MASRSISAILWTLVSVNVITLIVGGLTTWLGYAIPVRLKQFGLLPGLVIVAGFASLIVACIGLCALNYSSYHALNIYGFSCMVFIMMLVFGIPETWYKSHQFGEGSLLMDIIYFTLVIVLTILLISAFTFAQYLRRKEMARNANHLGSSCESPPCLCSSQHHHQYQTEDDMSNINHPTSSHSIIDKWLPWTNHNSDRHNLDEISLAPRKNCCHLSECHARNSAGNQFKAGIDCADNNCKKSTLHNNHALSNQPCMPLVHKGFYKSGANISNSSGLVRAKSFNHPLNEQRDDYDTRIQESQTIPNSDCGWNKMYRSCNLNQSLIHASRDDTLVQYGRGEAQIQQHYHLPAVNSRYSMTNRRSHHHHHHHNQHNQGRSINQQINQYTRPKCNCNLGSSVSMGPRQDFNTLEQRRYFSNELASNTISRLQSSSYAMRAKPKLRAKGSSSVVAMTAAAAVALFGGVADTCSARSNDNNSLFVEAGDGINGGDGGGDVDTSLLDRCILDSNDHQINVSIQNDLSSNIHRNVCRQPVLDFAPLLDFRKP